jgi:hypothetical protein
VVVQRGNAVTSPSHSRRVPAANSSSKWARTLHGCRLCCVELCLCLCSHSGADGSIEHLAIGNRAGSWSLGAFHTAPEFDDATPNDKLKLGKCPVDRHLRALSITVLMSCGGC